MGTTASPCAIDGRRALDAVEQALARLGFYQAHRSRSGSRYLRLPRSPFRVRLSDHEHPTLYCDVLHSRVIGRLSGPEEAHLVAAEIATAFTGALRARLGLIGRAA